MAESPGPGEADQALNDLGWADLLYASPRQAAAMAFSALGTTGSAATLLDDVVTHALGLGTTPDVCVLFPAPLHANPAEPEPDDPPIFFQEDAAVLNGIVSSRIDQAFVMVLAVEGDDGPEFATLQSGFLRNLEVTGVDPAHAYRHVSIRARAEYLTPLKVEGKLGVGHGRSPGSPGPPAHRWGPPDAGRSPPARPRPGAVRPSGGVIPGRPTQAGRVAGADRRGGIGGRSVPARPRPPVGGAGQVAGRPSRSHNPPPMPSKCWPGSASPPNTDSTSGSSGCWWWMRCSAPPTGSQPRSAAIC